MRLPSSFFTRSLGCAFVNPPLWYVPRFVVRLMNATGVLHFFLAFPHSESLHPMVSLSSLSRTFFLLHSIRELSISAAGRASLRSFSFVVLFLKIFFSPWLVVSTGTPMLLLMPHGPSFLGPLIGGRCFFPRKNLPSHAVFVLGNPVLFPFF